MRLPTEPKKGESIASKVSEIIRYLRASTVRSVVGGKLIGSASGQVIEIPNGIRTTTGKAVILPLDVFNLTKDGATFTVSVRPGYVIERTVINATDTDCLTYHEPTGITSMGAPVEHEVADGEAIFVKATVQDNGTISATEVVVDANDKKSTHYAPPVGDETAGAVGEYYYKLAEFTTDGDTLAIERFHAGANIEHFQELPRFQKAGGTADIFKTFDQPSGKYKTRGLTGIDGINVTQGGDEITIGLGGVENLHLQVVVVDLSIDFTGETFSFGSITTVDHYWENGLYVGITEPTDPDYDPIFQRVTHIANTNANP